MIGCQCDVCRSADERDQRLRSAALVHTDGGSAILIDAGMDFRQQMLRHAVCRLDAILITHQHKDHMGGLDDIRALNHCMQSAIPVYAQEQVLAAIRSEFAYSFAPDAYAGLPQMDLHSIANAPFMAADTMVTPVYGLHHKMSVAGFRLGCLAYITDMNYLPPESMERLRGCSVLVINALRMEKHASHFSLSDALEIIDSIKPQRAYLTHISHQLGRHSHVQSMLPPQVFLAYDGLAISV
jgi:phosphoribosyl 1,2-cyclic phosphate phosphodiesterase